MRYNAAAAPFKLNNDPSGVVLLHNTVYRYREVDIYGPYEGNAWPQLGEPANYAANVWIENNIFVGADTALFIRQEMPLLRLDSNGYSPDGWQRQSAYVSRPDCSSLSAAGT